MSIVDLGSAGVRAEEEDGVLTVTIDRPEKRNAFLAGHVPGHQARRHPCGPHGDHPGGGADGDGRVVRRRR